MKNSNEPRLALSIRQPWAWLIVNGHKDVENRNWPTKFRGWVYVHAAKGMTKWEYEVCRAMTERIKPLLLFPEFTELDRGGIVGRVKLIDCVSTSSSPWFVGDFGFVLTDYYADSFRPCKGMLGFFAPAL